MAPIHTDLPSGDGHWGENQFANRLAEIAGERTHLWFGVDYLAGVNDIDAVLAYPDFGFFVIEVKAVTLDAIDDYGPGLCKIRNRQGTQTPVQQSRRAQIQLLEYLRDVAGLTRPPWFYVTAAFPRISRHDFLQRFNSPAVRAQADGMLFEEDLASAEALRELLGRTTARPPIGSAPSRPRTLRDGDIAAIATALSPTSAVQPSSMDVARMRVVERRPSPGEQRYLTPGQDNQVLFRGAPGTGKTFKLLKIALAHAAAERSVLFVCYNKVLAADLRRMLQAAQITRAARDLLDVVDIFQVLGRYPTPTDLQARSADEFASQKVEHLRRYKPPPDRYGTILVDESQDMQDWAFDLLTWMADSDAEWFVADGEGQSLYLDKPSDWLQNFAESATIAPLKRVFRTAQADFYVAQCTHETSPDKEQIPRWLAVHPVRPPNDQLTLDLEEFDRLGDPPELTNMPGIPETVPFAEFRAEVVRFYAKVIGEELALLERIGASGDLAILVPNEHEKGAEGERIRHALEHLGVDFVDQVDDDHRRKILPPDHVRLVTFHSARGIEAARVLIVGFEALGRRLGGPDERQRNLAYIALSRARHGSRLIVPSTASGPHLEFVRALVGTLRREIDSLSTEETAPHTLLTSEWRKGHVKALVPDKGFGFIEPEPRGDDTVFFHVNALVDLPVEDIDVGLGVVYTSSESEPRLRANLVSTSIPNGLAQPSREGLIPALVKEPIGDRGFGFLLSPMVDGRIFMHAHQLDGLSAEDATVGTRLDVELSYGPDGKPRAARVMPPA